MVGVEQHRPDATGVVDGSQPSTGDRGWVELRGFEPLTPWLQTRCSAGLSYSPVESGMVPVTAGK